MTGTSRRARIALHTSKPVAPGMLMSRITRSGDFGVERANRGRAVAGLDHEIARLRQREGHQA